MVQNDVRLAAGFYGAPYAAPRLVFWSLPAWAQAPGSSLGTSYSANADKPIDIESDALEVDDKKKLATFKGNVSATQGDFNIRAKELQVTYTAAKKDPAAAPSTAAASAKKARPTPPSVTPATNPLVPGGGADITQIDAKGKVLITTKDNQTTTSDWAVFEVKKQLVTIGGDVVLTQGTNTIKGTKLVIDLNTGLSRFDTAGDKAAGAPTERLRAIFTPKSRPEKSKVKPDAEKAELNAADGRGPHDRASYKTSSRDKIRINLSRHWHYGLCKWRA